MREFENETAEIFQNLCARHATQRAQADGCLHLEIKGASASRFCESIGFALERKQRALDAYITDRRWFKAEAITDQIVSIERGEADVFDITVEVAHAYVANGMVNHNSFWHARIIRDLDLGEGEYVEFAKKVPERRSKPDRSPA